MFFNFERKKTLKIQVSKMAIFWPYVIIFWKLHWYLLQNWDSDSHFEVLNMSKYWFDQKLQQKTQKFSFLFFYHFVKQKAENLCLLKGNFKIISGYFLANYIHVFYKTEDQMVILRSLTCLNLNWIKAYDILLVKVFFSCLQMHDFKCNFVSFLYLRTKSVLIFSK